MSDSRLLSSDPEFSFVVIGLADGRPGGSLMVGPDEAARVARRRVVRSRAVGRRAVNREVPPA